MKVIITDHAFPHVSQENEIITKAGFDLVVAQCKTPQDVITASQGADALIVQWAPINQAVIESLTNCKIIVRYGIGVDNVDLKSAARCGIAVCNIPDYCINEVADHALALALALARQLPQTDKAVREGAWKITPPNSFPAFQNIVFATAGFGRIARAVLERAKPFGFKLAAYDPFVDEEAFKTAGVYRLGREELFNEAGIISLHLPLNSETKHFINREHLANMQTSSIIVNTARGGLIDTLALAHALASRTIAGAGLDVFETEPLPKDHPLRQSPNTLLTSHTAWYSEGSIPELQRKVAEEVVRGLRGQQLVSVVNGVRNEGLQS